jgi:hypothetical protein
MGKDADSSGNVSEQSPLDAAAEAFTEVYDDLLGGPAEEQDEEKTESTGDEPEPDEETLGESDGEQEGDEAEDAEEADEGEEDAEAEESKPTPPVLKDEDPVFTVDEDGTAKPVTRAEAKAGYMRTKDYTQKQMARAAAERAANEALATYGKLNEQYKVHLDKILADAPDEAALVKLKAEDPERYLLTMEEIRQTRDERNAAAAEADRVKTAQEKAQAEADAQALADHLTAEREKLHAALPRWKDEKVQAREGAAIRTFLVSKGFTPEQITAGLRDHRLVLMIRDAALYAQMKAKGATKVVPQAEKSLRPGTDKTRSTGKKASLAKADAALRRSGKPADAARAFELMGLGDV